MATPVPAQQPPHLPLAHSLLDDMEEGQLALAAADLVAHDDDDLEEGQLPPHAFAAASLVDDDDHDSVEVSIGRVESSRAAEERELDELLEEDEPVHARLPVIVDVVAPTLLHVRSRDDASAPPSGSLWSLPLPARPADAPSTRSRLLALDLPALHVDAVLQHYAREAATEDVQLSQWVDRVMECMYLAERAQQDLQRRSSANGALPPAEQPVTAVPSASEQADLSAAASSAVICGICWDPISPVPSALPSCQHAFCAPCWNGYLSSKILDGSSVLHLRCPHAQPSPCKRELNAVEVHARLSTPLMRDKYDRQAELARIAQDPAVRWCPTPNCESVLRGGSTAAPHLTCARCHAELCFRCSSRWHPNQTCAEASSASLSPFLAASAVGSPSNPDEIKCCPRCGIGIQRASGCNFLRCTRCSAEFCWLCLGEYTDAHFAWWNLRGCPLLHLDRFSWLADDSCCGLRCSCGCGCAGMLKRTLLRCGLALLYAIAFLLALPFLLVASPYLVYRYVRDGDKRARRQELRRRNRDLSSAQQTSAASPPAPIAQV